MSPNAEANAAGQLATVEQADADVLGAELGLPEADRQVVVEIGVVRRRLGQDDPVGAAALEPGGVQAERQLVLAADVDGDADVVEVSL